MRHAFGDDALRARGAITHEDTSELLGGLHDHLGRHTVENPDLAHRAERLGNGSAPENAQPAA